MDRQWGIGKSSSGANKGRGRRSKSIFCAMKIWVSLTGDGRRTPTSLLNKYRVDREKFLSARDANIPSSRRVRTLTFRHSLWLMDKRGAGTVLHSKDQEGPPSLTDACLKEDIAPCPSSTSHEKREREASPNCIWIREQSVWLLFEAISPLDSYPLPSLIAFRTIRWFLIKPIHKEIARLKDDISYRRYHFEHPLLFEYLTDACINSSCEWELYYYYIPYHGKYIIM